MDKFRATIREITNAERRHSEETLVRYIERVQEADSEVTVLRAKVRLLEKVLRSKAWKALVKEADAL